MFKRKITVVYEVPNFLLGRYAISKRGVITADDVLVHAYDMRYPDSGGVASAYKLGHMQKHSVEVVEVF